MFIVQVWIEHAVRSLDQTFTYLSDRHIEQGCRVSVPFGARTLVGFTESCQQSQLTKQEYEQQEGMSFRYIHEVLDEHSLITPELHDMAMWMKQATLSTTISCFQAMLPQKVKPASNRKNVVMEKWVMVSNHEVDLTPKQLEAYMFVQQHGQIRYSMLRKQYPNQAKQLMDKGALTAYEKEKEDSLSFEHANAEMKQLTDIQQKAYDEIMHTDDLVYLLKGVTGSGKTEVYLHAAQQILQQGKQVLILVPEIALTPQMIERVSSRFPSSLAIYHSGLNPQEKYEQYRMVKNRKAQIVVATRSGVFLPFTDLGLIIVDEEHDSSYKQNSQPCYHGRDAAIWRAQYNHCKVILGSATPSLDSYARALKNVYHLVTMNQRINESLPEVSVVSMRAQYEKSSMILSKPLQDKIRQRLSDHEQIILLLNRRGYHSQFRCRSCGELLLCPHCDLALSYHRDVHRLKCHTCGFETMVPKVCPHCGSDRGFTTLGYGTQKLEDEVHYLFPGVRTLRMDADTTSRKNGHASILSSFGKREADILLGTQMIAKGLDYPNVTLVGILNGDEGLTRSDFRSCEATFDLLMQASGRSGRSDKKGEVIVQVFDGEHYAIKCAANQDYDHFFQYEMNYRHAGSYPPYTYLITLTMQASSQEKADELAMTMKQQLHGDFKVLGIISLRKIQDIYRSRIILKGKNLDQMRNAVSEWLQKTDINTKGLRIDVNPQVLDE